MVWPESLIEPLAVEWSSIVATGARRLKSWPTLITGVEDEYQRLVSEGRWTVGRADLLGLIGRNRDELVHSALLAWLLRPDGTHGLGSSFFNLFAVRILEVEADSIGSVGRVACEVQRYDTRADIIVWTDQLTVVIENKIDAGEGDRQCDRLYQHFQSELDPLFVFLSPTGRPPVTATGLTSGRFLPVAYRDVARILEVALDQRQTRAAGRGGAVDYLRTLREEFGG